MGFLCAGLPREASPPPWVWRSVQCADYETLRSVPLQPSRALPPEGQGWRRGPVTLEAIPDLGNEALLGGGSPWGGSSGADPSWVTNEHHCRTAQRLWWGPCPSWAPTGPSAPSLGTAPGFFWPVFRFGFFFLPLFLFLARGRAPRSLALPGAGGVLGLFWLPLPAFGAVRKRVPQKSR